MNLKTKFCRSCGIASLALVLTGSFIPLPSLADEISSGTSTIVIDVIGDEALAAKESARVQRKLILLKQKEPVPDEANDSSERGSYADRLKM